MTVTRRDAISRLLGATALAGGLSVRHAWARSASERQNPALAAIADERLRFDQAQFDYRATRNLPVDSIPFDDEAAAIARAAAAKAMLRRLADIPTASLSETDHLLYDVLTEQATQEAGDGDFYWLKFSIVPYAIYDRLNAVHGYIAAAALDTTEDRRRYLALIDDYGRMFDRHRAKLDGQAARGIRLSRASIATVDPMLRELMAQLDPRFVPAPARLAGLPPAAAEAFRGEVVTRLAAGPRRSLATLIATLAGDHADHAAPEPGLANYPGAAAFYRHQIRSYTSLSLTPEAIFALGQRRVREIEADIIGKAAAIGLTGTIREIYTRLRTDPRLIATSAEQARTTFLGYIAQIDPKLPRYFRTLPKAPYGVQALPPDLAGSMTFGFYKPPTGADGSGYYMFNGSKIEQRSQLVSQAVIYHELVPGHHFQVMTQRESTTLPALLKPYRDNSFVEGWAEYAAGLAEEMGLYDDPYKLIGRRSMELFFAVRLVVDTALAHYGWPLEKVRTYMGDHLFLSRTEIETESIRYATEPGQVLAYRIGYEFIRDARARAERALGPRFDIRDFHALVLEGGSPPLSALGKRVDRWIERGGGA